MSGVDIHERVTREEFVTELTPIVAVAVLTIVVDTVGRWALTAVVGVGVRPLALLVVLATAAVGLKARWGVAVGLLGSGLLLSDWSGGVVIAIAAFAAATLCDRLRVGPRPQRQWHRRFGHVAVVLVLTTLTLGATAAWLSDTLGLAAFSIVVVRSVATNAPLALLGIPVVMIVAEVGRKRKWTGATHSEEPSMRQTLLTGVVLIVWVGGGYFGSFMYRAVNTVPLDTFARRFGVVAVMIIRVGGPQGRFAVFCLGVVAIGAMLAIFEYRS
jgi:hypothetical protein